MLRSCVQAVLIKAPCRLFKSSISEYEVKLLENSQRVAEIQKELKIAEKRLGTREAAILEIQKKYPGAYTSDREATKEEIERNIEAHKSYTERGGCLW